MSLFFRMHTDGTQTPAALENQYAGATASACWLIGGGPSLAALPCEAIGRSPVPRMCVNLSGTRLLRPTFWTAYDPTARFHRSVYFDAGVTKFVHRRRAMDLVPETTAKVCDCPATYFFERDSQRGFGDFLSPAHAGIVDWNDSMVQAIEILYRLGFRTIYLAGCEMQVRPSEEQQQRARDAGVTYQPGELLNNFVWRCNAAGISSENLEAAGPAAQYHFDEHKPLKAAVNTDHHYFRIAQYLRLSRRALSLAGVRLISVTPESRLNDYFPFVPVADVLEQIRREVGDPAGEPVRGLYTGTGPRQPEGLGPMRDFRPHNWPADRAAKPEPPRKRTACDAYRPKDMEGEILIETEGPQRLEARTDRSTARQRLAGALREMPDVEPYEEG